MNNLINLVEKYINHTNQMYAQRVETLKITNQITAIAYNNLKLEMQSIKDMKKSVEKEQDKLIQHLNKVDNIERTLAEIQQSTNQMVTKIRRIKTKISDYNKLK